MSNEVRTACIKYQYHCELMMIQLIGMCDCVAVAQVDVVSAAPVAATMMCANHASWQAVKGAVDD